MRGENSGFLVWVMFGFSIIGMLLYVLIGLPIAGIILGWIIARDEVMGKARKPRRKKDEAVCTGGE